MLCTPLVILAATQVVTNSPAPAAPVVSNSPATPPLVFETPDVQVFEAPDEQQLMVEAPKTLHALARPDSGALDTRVGFRFASLCLDDEEGSTTGIPHSRAKIDAVASLMIRFPHALLTVEGHVGISAPDDVAQTYSEARAFIVAQILEEEHGICPGRVLTRGWAARVSEMAMSSNHPNADAAKNGFGWVDLYLSDEPYGHPPGFVPTPSDAMIPSRPSYYPDALLTATDEDDTLQSSPPPVAPSPPPPPPSVQRTSPGTHPIFYMYPGAAVGERVALHFFEPRYRLLIRRAWASDKRFVFCAGAPFQSAARSSFNLALGEEPQGDKCSVVRVDDARFDDDDTADIEGVAVAEIVLRDALLEPGTGGLFSTRTNLPAASPSPRTPSSAAIPLINTFPLTAALPSSTGGVAALVPEDADVVADPITTYTHVVAATREVQAPKVTLAIIQEYTDKAVKTMKWWPEEAPPRRVRCPGMMAPFTTLLPLIGSALAVLCAFVWISLCMRLCAQLCARPKPKRHIVFCPAPPELAARIVTAERVVVADKFVAAKVV